MKIECFGCGRGIDEKDAIQSDYWYDKKLCEKCGKIALQADAIWKRATGRHLRVVRDRGKTWPNSKKKQISPETGGGAKVIGGIRKDGGVDEKERADRTCGLSRG